MSSLSGIKDDMANVMSSRYALAYRHLYPYVTQCRCSILAFRVRDESNFNCEDGRAVKDKNLSYASSYLEMNSDIGIAG